MQSVVGAIYRSQELYTAYCPSVVQRVVESTGNGFDYLVDNVVQCVQERFPNLLRPELAVAFTASVLAVASHLLPDPIDSCAILIYAIAINVSVLRNDPSNTVNRVQQLCNDPSLPLRERVFLIQHVFENKPLADIFANKVQKLQASAHPQPAAQKICLAAAVFLNPTPEECQEIQRRLPLPRYQRSNATIQGALNPLYNKLADEALHGELCKPLRWLSNICGDKEICLSFRLRLGRVVN